MNTNISRIFVKEITTKTIEIMKTLNNYKGTDKNKFNDKYNFVAVIFLTETQTVLMYASQTYEGCLKATSSKWKKRIGFENAIRYEIKELS